MRRRAFLCSVAGALLAAAPVAAQSPGGPPLIGFLPLGAPSNPYDRSFVEAFRQGLREAGVVENRDLVLEVVWTNNELEVSQAVVRLVQRGAKLLIPARAGRTGSTGSSAPSRRPSRSASSSGPAR
jgi:putative ABC transport system substrate-binding protein